MPTENRTIDRKPIVLGRFYYVKGPDQNKRFYDPNDLIDQNWTRYYSGFCQKMMVMPITSPFVDDYPYKDGKRQKEMVAVIVAEHAGRGPIVVQKDGKKIELHTMSLPTEWLMRAKPDESGDGFDTYCVKDCRIILEQGYEEKCRLAAEKAFNRSIGQPVGTEW